MEAPKATINNFVKYLENNNLSSGLLLHTLKRFDGYFYDFDVKKNFDDITYITDKAFLKERNVGVKSLAEFKKLRTNYLQYLYSKKDCDRDSNTFIGTMRKNYSCLLRSDILETLKTIEDEINFVEIALLEKFERDGIKLVKINQENETT